MLACAAAAALLATPCGCGRSRRHEQVLRDLAAAAEQMARVLERAESLEDLKAREARLRALVRRLTDLKRDSARLGKAPAPVLRRYGPRAAAALEKIAGVLADWSRRGKWDMLEYVDGLKPK